MLETEHAFKHFQSYGSLPDDYSILTQHAFHGLVDALASHLGIVGPRYVVSTACSSSAKVFGSALRLMQSDLVDAVLVGGADSLCQITLRGFSSLGILSEHLCRPFGQGRDGINLGEGAALLLLERQEGGIQVRGVGESSDAHHMSAPDPEGKGARMAIMQALQQAGLDGKEVDYVNAHGTGTVLNDHMESRVLLEVCGKDVPVVSTKGYTGHMLGAAGATEAVFVVAALEQGWIPISLGALPLDSNIEIRVNTDSYECFCRHAMSTSFAFGGSNAAVVLSRT
jgi:3-oxoacyl-[acyl-carrier-protein] synthase-1